MNAEADKLRADIASAEARLEAVESRPVPASQLAQVQHQIKLAKDGLRNMRIQLASLEADSSVCPVCIAAAPRGWLVCEACSREVPARLHTAWQCARCLAHAAKQNKKPATLIAQLEANESAAADLIISHLKQHGTALAA